MKTEENPSILLRSYPIVQVKEATKFARLTAGDTQLT